MSAKKKVKADVERKLNIGCGENPFEGWCNLDIRSLPGVSLCSNAMHLPFKDKMFNVVHASHLIEHFDYLEAFDALKEWKRVLKPGGTIILECPDFLGLCYRFIKETEQGRVGLYMHIFGNPWIVEGDLKPQIHKFMYTPSQLKWTLEQMGFKNIIQTAQKRFPGGDDINLRMEAIK